MTGPGWVVAAGSVVALTDRRLVVLGGTWGPHPAVVRAVSEALADQPRAVPVPVARATAEPSLAGARHRALQDLRRRRPDPAAAGVGHRARSPAPRQASGARATTRSGAMALARAACRS